MVEFQNKRDKLDYSQIVFRQIDRIAMLMCQTNTGGIRSAANNNTFSALCALEGLIVHRLTQKDQEEFSNVKKKYGFNRLDVSYSNISTKANKDFFYILMHFINKSNLLPAERTSYESGAD